MAEENKEFKRMPPPLPNPPGAAARPPLPFLPPPPASAAPPLPSGSFPALPPLAAPAPRPNLSGAGALPPFLGAAPGAGRPAEPSPEKLEYERKLAEIEKRLADEHEKLLLANLKSQEESATAARVEVSIKDLQEKLRRDRREQEHEEARLKLESKLQEMEERLAQERETWVTTLRNQMNARQGQDKEIESHFALRMQEMERRWLDEKAQWQKLALAKDEEIRSFRSLAEKLKGVDGELAKALADKSRMAERLDELSRDRAEALGKIQALGEKERENVSLRTEINSLRMHQERDMYVMRADKDVEVRKHKDEAERAKEEVSRLRDELQKLGAVTVTLDRIEAEGKKYKEEAENARAEIQKIKAVAAILEKQLGSSRARIMELHAAKASWDKTQEKYKTEFMAIQRKWVEREKEIRSNGALQLAQLLDGEKEKLKALSQEELNQRVAKIAEQMQRENGTQKARLEAEFRAQLERDLVSRTEKLQTDWDNAREELEKEIDRLHKEMLKRDADWSRRFLSTGKSEPPQAPMPRA